MLLMRERPLAPAGLLPVPAPLLSLTAALSRRSAIFGAVAASGALVVPAAQAGSVRQIGDLNAEAASEADTMAALHAEADALRAATERATSDDELDRLSDRLADIERRAVALRVSTPAGAVAALEWVRADLLREDGSFTAFGFYPALIGQALDVLRRGIAP